MPPDKFIVIFAILVMATFPSVVSQSLDLPAESFACGPLNVTCDRWGYTACVNPDGNYYCIPCSQEYISHLCGTKDQLQGCNLYCTQKELDKQRKRLHLQFTKEKEKMQNNFTETLQIEKYHSQNQTEQYQDDMQSYLREIKSLREVNAEERTYKWIFFAVLLLSILTLGGLLIRLPMRQKRNQTSADIESQNLLKNKQKESRFNGLEGSHFSKKNITASIDKSNSDVYHSDQQGSKDEPYNVQCTGDSCPGKELLQNVPTTIDQEDDAKMALRNHDVELPVGV